MDGHELKTNNHALKNSVSSVSDDFLAHIFVKDYIHLLQQHIILCIHKQHQEKVPL